MKADENGLVRDKEGRLACDVGKEPMQVELRDLGEKEIGFTEEEARELVEIVQGQIKMFEAKKGLKGKAKAKKLVKEVTSDEGMEDSIDSTPGDA